MYFKFTVHICVLEQRESSLWSNAERQEGDVLSPDHPASPAVSQDGDATGKKKNNLLVSGLMLSPSMSHLTHSLGQRFQSKLLLCTLSSQRGDQNYKVWASASIFPLILSMPCCCCGVFWLVVCALGEESPLLRSLGTICTPNPIRKDKDLGRLPPLQLAVSTLAFLVKTTNPLSSRSPASSPAPRPPLRASPRACSTPRTLRSTRTWRPCWRPPVSAGRAPRHWGFALAAGPAGVSASSFFLATFLVAQQPQGDPSTCGGPLAVPSQKKGSEDPDGISVLEVVSWGMGTQNNFPEVLRCGLQSEGVESTSWHKLFPLPLSTWLPTHTPVFIPVFIVGHSWFMFSKMGHSWCSFLLIFNRSNRRQQFKLKRKGLATF